MKNKAFLIVAILFSITIQAQTLNINPVTLEIGSSYEFRSNILNEERTLLIHLPKSYENSAKKYPVIYVLDGNNHFHHASIAITILEENEKIPESIIVAIPNNTGTRGRDLVRERNNFKLFLKSEVIAFIDENYRTTNQRTIFGHSMAGAFILDYLVTEPSLFDNYIAASPVIQILKSELITKFDDAFKSKKPLKKALYFTLTEKEAEGEAATEAMNKFVTLLKEKAPQSLDWEYEYIENQIHMTTPYLTFYQGLAKINKNFVAQ